MRRLLLFYIIVLFCPYLKGQGGKILLEGRYQGKNIYVSNPYAGNMIGFCVTKVFVNEKEIAFENSSAFEIDLKILDLKLGDSLRVVIEHGADCKPKIINTDNGHPRSTFLLVSIEISPEGTLKWTATEEINKLPFIVEQFRWNKWIKVGEAGGMGGEGENYYETKVLFHSGKNQFRVKQVDYSGPLRWSKPATFICDTCVNVTYTIDKTRKQIIFSKETLYELYDKESQVVKRGLGKEIDCSGLKKAKYYMNYDNTTTDITFKWE